MGNQPSAVTRKHHHEYSPSRLRRVQLCPGSVEMEAQVPEKVGGAEEAVEGTMLHTKVNPSASLDDLNDEQRHAVEKARAYVEEKTVGAVQVMHEVSLTLWGPNDLVVTAGTSDVLAVFPMSITVIDLKFGRAELFQSTVELQMRCYAAAAMQRFVVNRAEAFVYQPREDVDYSGSYSNPSQIAGEILEVIEYSKAHPEQLNPSLEACQHCRGKVICTALEEGIRQRVPQIREHLYLLDPSQISRALEFASLVEPWAKELRARARAMIEGGLEVQGWTVAERNIRKISDVTAAFNATDKVLSQDEFLSTTKVQIGDLEKAYTQKLKEVEGVTIKEAKERFKEAISDIVEIDAQRYLKRTEG